MKIITYILFILLLPLFSIQVYSQQITDKTHQSLQKNIKGDTTLILREKEEYPYRLPFLGQNVYDKGYSLPLPIGFSVSYVNTSMGMGITDLGVNLNPVDPSLPYFGQNIPQEKVDELVDGPILESLNDNVTYATASGFNYRLDTYILPFLNVYGMVSQVKGTTSIGLGNSENGGFGSTVDFDALAYGGGFTLAYGYQGWFGSVDINYALSDTDLLEEQIAVSTYSMRVGKKFNINRGKQSIAVYIGAMNRNFTNSNATPGKILLSEVIQNDIDLSEPITSIYNGLDDKTKLLIKRALGKEPDGSMINDHMNGMIDNTSVDYSIKKELLQTWTVQCGFSIELSKHFAIRGEYGIEQNNKFLMTGINYRFGVKK
ncbi:hypothetical protein [Flammeovirga sp. SJP92]|uniref:hypothetical protein n=1 Tax=Flammeovirga sp. SJP92 TaxID=1775430 RepID=UPI000787F809|nr:hypothetical protein [Flammeovirga sp. SJP92]KXX67390.1 hypothetical protein AVL50_27220 [Flammeovirga sp. SJP92]